MKKQQTINENLINYVSINAKEIIKNLINLIQYQENVVIDYSLKKIESN